MQSGLMLCSAVHTAVRLDLATHLKTPKSLAVLASETQTHAPSLYLLLRALAASDIFIEQEEATHTFAHTQRSRLLIPDEVGSQAALVRLWGAGYQWDAWQHLLHTIQTGKPALEVCYGDGTTIWSHLIANPQEMEGFQRGLTDVSNLVIPAILATYDFSSLRHIVDVGGGYGNLAVTLLRTYPTLHATLFDRASIIEQVQRDFRSALSEDVVSRYTLAAGNFFEAIPSGADCYILKNVLMDWSDEEYVQILRQCRRAIGEHAGRILVIESVISEDSTFTKFFTLQMAMMMRAARHRTLEEHQALFASAGFRLMHAFPLGLEQLLFEGTPSTAPGEE
jgi:precorrin-6B methylase 2